MTNQEAFDIQSAKITIIGNISMIYERCSIPQVSFEEMNNYNLSELRELQEITIKDYNKVVSK